MRRQIRRPHHTHQIQRTHHRHLIALMHRIPHFSLHCLITMLSQIIRCNHPNFIIDMTVVKSKDLHGKGHQRQQDLIARFRDRRNRRTYVLFWCRYLFTNEKQIPSPSNDQPYRNRAESTASLLGKPGERGINENIESAELQNPSDALEILARAADQQSDGDSPRSQPTQPNSKRPSSHREPQCSPKMDDYLHYKPVVDGLISPDMIYQLFSEYV